MAQAKKTKATRRVQALSRKGGAGKTTTIGNLAEALGLLGYSVLAVDLDANASLSKAFISLRDVKHSIFDLLMSPVTLIETEDVIVELPGLHFDLLPGSEILAYAEPTLMAAGRQAALKERLSEVEHKYDFVLVDTAGHESFMHTLGHLYADEVVMPIEADITHWEALVLTLKSVDKVRTDGLNPNIRVKAILVTRYQQGTKFGDGMIKKLTANYKDLMFPMVTRQTIRLREAQLDKQPIVAHNPEAQPSEVYMKLAEYLANE